MNFFDKKILVTGGAGFIGSHLVKKLVDIGSDVTVADDLSRGSKRNLESIIDSIDFRKVDVMKMENCKVVTEDAELVFHLAASVGGIQFITKNNVGGLTPSILMNTNILEACRINDVERFLFTSSACVYRDRGKGLNHFKEEDAIPANPLTTYGWAKILGEVLCKAYYNDYGIKCSVPRIFNAYGENENLDPRWSHVIPSLIRKAILYPETEFSVYGDGEQERAFLYVKDCVEGLLLNMEKVIDAEPLNLGSDEVVSISDLAKRIMNISDKEIDIQYDLTGPRGTDRYCADISRMWKILGWKPDTPLDEGLKLTYEWTFGELNVSR